MAAIPGAARAYVACAALGAAACALPAAAAPAATPWGALALLAGLYGLCERPGVRPRAGRLAGADPPAGHGSAFPVLLAAALLLPPSAAALAVLAGALAAPVEQRSARRTRRIWRPARLALAAWAAAHTAALLHGPAALGGPGPAGPLPPDLPYALLPAGAAVLASCAVLAALDGGILATAERVPPRAAWRGLFGRSLAAHAVHGLVGLVMAVLWCGPYGWPAALLLLLPMSTTSWAFTQYHRERAAHHATIRALVQAVDLKDAYTRGHSERVGRASVMIGRELGMAEERLEVLRFAGTLHDVGKLGVPTRVLRKNGPLTPEERRIIELHPEYGHEMTRGIGFLGEARAAILHHHERLDGGGYPYGLRGAQIPEVARVVAVADAFDAMTSTRSYRRARPVGAALAELDRCSGSHFDPVMVRALARALARHGWRTAVTSDEPAPPDGPAPGPVPHTPPGLPAQSTQSAAAPDRPPRTGTAPTPGTGHPSGHGRVRGTGSGSGSGAGSGTGSGSASGAGAGERPGAGPGRTAGGGR
ncbi:HD-GYP domain-containing protein [Streptomyces kanasensis]|uniref:HD-GYP domain-containing protein n=1 Tax=Streptomyces kanasensis TaxID=936756 RepID=UPI00381BBBED